MYPGKIRWQIVTVVLNHYLFSLSHYTKSCHTFSEHSERHSRKKVYMEIERKYLIKDLPENLDSYPHLKIEQGYLCTAPVVRIRQQDDLYILTYKSSGLMVREEYNLPLTKEAYLHLREKTDGLLISKTRYVIPLDRRLKIELDVFSGDHEGLILAEVEFPDEETANSFVPPAWFGDDVTFCSQYHNSYLSQNPSR